MLEFLFPGLKWVQGIGYRTHFDTKFMQNSLKNRSNQK